MARYNYSKYRGENTQSEETRSSGRYNYDKYREPEKPQPSFPMPEIDVRQTPIMQAAASAPVAPPEPQSPGRDLPVIGPVLKALDVLAKPSQAIAEYTVPDAPLISQGQSVPGTNAREAFLERTGAEPATGAAKVLGQIVAPFAVPGAGLGTGANLYRQAGQVLDNIAPALGRTTGGRVAREAVREAAVGAPLAAGIELAQGSGDLSEAAEQGLIGGAVGAVTGGAIGAVSPAVRRAIEQLFGRRQQEVPQEILALPSPRPRALREGPAPSGPVIEAPGEVAVFGLPEPDLLPPTRARIEQRVNPYRQKYEELIQRANQMQFTPGRELEELESLWSQMAGRDDPNLDQLIDLAYPSRPNRVTPDLIRRAREYQRVREVAGVPLPVRTLQDRYPQGQVRGTVAMPQEQIQINAQSRVSQMQPRVEQRPQPPASQLNPPINATSQEIVTPLPRQTRAPGERGLITSLRESGRLTEDVQRGLDTSPSRTYQPITNQATVEAANRRVAKDIDRAENFALGGTRKELSAEQVATGFRLIDEFQRSGQIERAVNMAERLAERLTQAGQSIQAASIWNRLTPEGALVAAQRIVNRVNEQLPKNAPDVRLTPETATEIQNAAAAIQRSGASQQRAADVMDILDRMKNGQGVTAEERQAVVDFIRDAREFVRPSRPRTPRPPKELSEPRIRDQVVSFLDAQERAAKERLRARGIQISSNPLDVYADYAIIGAAKLGKGVVRFADWSEQMVRELGEEIRPHLESIYNRAQELLTENTKRISAEAYSQAERIAESYLKKNEANLSPEDIQTVRNLAQQVSSLSGDAKRAASQDLQAILNGFERAGVGRKLASTQYIFMLLNPVTQVRNIVGNELLYRLERLARITATPIDWAVSKLTGKEREITFAKGGWDQFFAPTKDYIQGLIEGSRAGWRGVNPEGLTTAYDISGQAFRSKLNPLTYLEKTLGAVMKGFDYASFNRTVNQRLREMAYLDAVNKGIQGRDNIRAHMDRYVANLDDNIAAIAKEYGKYVTLQDNTALSQALHGFKRILNLKKDFGVGNILIPFAKTPANLLMRAIDYSPIGFAKAIYQASQNLLRRDTDLTSADVIQSVTRALLGTGLSGVGLWLADKGVLRGESANDRDVRELEKQAGISQYQLNASALQRMLSAMVTGDLKDVDEAAKPRPGDIMWQYEWAQPSSIPLAVGANIVQERQQARRDLARKGESESVLKQSSDVVLGALNTLMNTSVLQGLQQAFDIPPGEDNYIKAFANNVLKQIPSMLVPSVVNRMNWLSDEYQRETRDTGLRNFLNPAISRIPGLAQDLPVRVDTLGQPVTRENNFFDVFLSPAQRNEFKPSAEAKLVMDLLAETGDERIAPRAVPRYITGTDPRTGQSKRIDLNAEQLTRYQTIVGQETAKRLARINPKASTEAKVRAVIKALDEAGEIGRRMMKRELGLR